MCWKLTLAQYNHHCQEFHQLPKELCQLFSEYRRQYWGTFFIIFHHYLPRYPPDYHLRIMFDHSHCQNIHSQSKKRCFKEFTYFRRKIPSTNRPFVWERGTLFGRHRFEVLGLGQNIVKIVRIVRSVKLKIAKIAPSASIVYHFWYFLGTCTALVWTLIGNLITVHDFSEFKAVLFSTTTPIPHHW